MNKKDKLNEAVKAFRNFLDQVSSGEEETFTVNLLFCSIAEYVGRMPKARFAALLKHASASCTARGCKCMDIRKKAFSVFAAMRADWQYTIELGRSRCKRFADKKVVGRLPHKAEEN